MILLINFSLASFGVHTSTKSLKDIATSDQMVTIAKDVNNNSEGNGTQQIPLYAFQTPSPQWQKRLTRDVPVPEPLFGIQKSITEIAPYQHEVQFYLGSAGTGAPTHYHGHAINSLAYGEKVSVYYFLSNIICMVNCFKIRNGFYCLPKKGFTLLFPHWSSLNWWKIFKSYHQNKFSQSLKIPRHWKY